jgi:parallel beta-helix repeat protein
MKKTFIFLLALVMALGISLIATMPVAADPGNTYYVSTTGSDVTGDGSYSNPWATIQHAVDNVSSGDTIMVAPGTYTGAIVDKGVTISGLGPGDSVIDTGVCYNSGCSPAYKTAFRLDAGADGAEISDFTINCDVNTSFFFAVFARAVDDIVIDSLEINDTVQGISNWGGSGWEITNNTITDTVASGGGGIGIFLGARAATSGYGTCRDNLVQYNTVDASASAEDYSCPAICLCYDLRYGGYLAVNGSEDISGNQILNNTITASAANNLIGIEVGTILGNSETDPIRDDPDEISAVMIAAALHDNAVQNNSVDGADTGIFFYNATNLTINANTVENNVGYGMYAEHGQSGTVITGNTFTNNDVQLMDDTDDTDTLDPLDIESILSNNTFDQAVTVDHPGASLLHIIWSSIQDGVDASVSGDTVNVSAGTYDETINVENFVGLNISGVDKTQVTIKPSTTLDWNVGGYGSSRQTVFRAVNSTDVVLQNMTMDFDLVKGNFIHGILYWDSTGTVDNNILKNMSVSDASGGYYEITSYYRADSYSPGSRADITISNNTFIDPGRLGACIHTYVDATITGNTFYKTTDDFGYAMELGSEATGSIDNNTIYGYDTAAASDGSNSAGIYVENSFTWSHVSPLTKTVSVTDNEVYDCQWGLHVGNEFNGYSGDVDIMLDLSDNNFHDNTDGGVVISDEDMESGSSVSVSGGGNNLLDNTDYGYYIYTQGDGDITIELTGETITGQGTGVYVQDTAGGSSTSSYSVSIQSSDISGNPTCGVNNTVSSFDVDATANWWGDVSGPYNATTNPSGTGNSVSDNVDYSPWWGVDYIGVSHPWEWYTNDSIQEAVDAVSAGDTINVMAGTYVESPEIVIDKNLSMIGAGSATTTIKPSGDTASKGAMLLINPDITFHISDVTLDGTGKKVWYGLKYQGGGSVTDCVFKNIQYNPSGPDYNGIAICAYGEAYDETIEFNDNVDITGCIFTGIGRVGVLYFGPGITDSTYSGNTYVGKGDGDWLDYALDVGSGPSVTITGSAISDCTGVASSDGSTSCGVMVTDLYKGYCPAYTSTEADITGNNISGCTSGICVGYDDDTDLSIATISGNNLENNDYQVGCTANANVDLEATLAGNTFDRAVVVRGSGIKVPTIFSSIQDAIDAAVAGDTVEALVATYDESVTIDKDNLTLVGEVGSKPAITGGLKLDDVSGFTLQNFEVTGTEDPTKNSLVRMYGVIADLTVDSCVFDGENTTDRNGFSGGQIEGDLTITDSEFKDIVSWAVLDTRSGSGGDGSAMGTVTFADNSVHDCDGSIVFRGLSTNWTDNVYIYGNTFQNIGEEGVSNHWAAFEVNRATDVEIYDNEIRNVVECSWGEGQAMQLWQIGTVSIHDNTIEDSYMGIAFLKWPTDETYDVSNISIHYNKFSGNDQYALSVEDGLTGGLVDATANWWGAATGPYHDELNPGGEGDTVSDNVLFEPWYGDEGMTTLVGHSTYEFVYDIPDVIVACEGFVVPATFETDELGAVGYYGVRFKFDATGPGDVIFKATDSEEVEHTFVNSGFWGPSDGLNLTADYSDTTDWSLNFSEPGEYNITFSLIDAPDGDVVAGIEGSEDITVRAVDILDHYRHLHEPFDEVTTLDLLAAADDWITNEAPPGFDDPITTMQLLALADEWFSS